jgi:hypothetical protein
MKDILESGGGTISVRDLAEMLEQNGMDELTAGYKIEENYEGLASEVARLRDEVSELRRVNRAPKPVQMPKILLPELHDQETGRIDAQKISEFIGVPLKQLAEGLDLHYKAVHRNPSAASFQVALQPVKRTLELLHEFFGPKETIRVWLNTPHPDLDGATSLATILEGKAFALVRILENARQGLPA